MRGEVWTLRDDLYASKARPVVIVQNDEVSGFGSVILYLLTTSASDNIPTRVRVEPAPSNGLRKTSYVMTDKIASVKRSMLGKKIGELDQATMNEVSKQLAVVLGLTSQMTR